MDHLSRAFLSPMLDEAVTPQPAADWARPRSGKGVPVTDQASLAGEDFLSTLPLRAQNLLNAARRLLVDEGFSSLKWERIAKEADEPKAMIRYYFKDTAGLLSVLLRVLSEEAMHELIELSEALPSAAST